MATKTELLNTAMDLRNTANKMSDVYGKIEQLQQELECLASEAGEPYCNEIEEAHGDMENDMISVSCVIEDIEEAAEEVEEQARAMFQLTLKNDLICCPACSSFRFRLTTVDVTGLDGSVHQSDMLECDTCDTVIKEAA